MKLPSQRYLEALRIVAEGRFYPDLVKEADGWHARWRALGSDNPKVDELVRGPSVTVLSEDAEDQRHETLHDAWAMALRSRTGLVRWDDAECGAFAAELSEWHGGADEDVRSRGETRFVFRAEADAVEVSCGLPVGRRRYRALGQAAYVWGALRALRESPFSVPEDVSLVSFDDNMYMDYLTPPIARVSQPVENMAKLAVKILCDMLAMPDERTANSQIRLMPTVILGNSVARPK